MTKTRIVGGKLIETTGGDYNIYTKESIVYSAATTITETGVESGVSFGNPEKAPLIEIRKYFVKGWWTDSKDKPIKKAVIGDTIRFHIETKDIPDGENITFTIYDWDGKLFLDDKVNLVISGTSTEANKIKISGNKGYVEWVTGAGAQSMIEEERDDNIELYVVCVYKSEKVEFPESTVDYLILYEKEAKLTIMIELPHSTETDYLNRKGLAGHTGIMIDSEYYDYGPQPGEPFNSKGMPWWDSMDTDGNLTKVEIMSILRDDVERYRWNIIGNVKLIDIKVRGSESKKVEDWWKNRYKNLGTYSVVPAVGEQCTTTVRMSIEKNTDVFNLFSSKLLDISRTTQTTQTPKGFLELLTSSGRHTYGKDKGKPLTVTEEFKEL